MPVVDVQMRLCPGFLLAVRHDVGGGAGQIVCRKGLRGITSWA